MKRLMLSQRNWFPKGACRAPSHAGARPAIRGASCGPCAAGTSNRLSSDPTDSQFRDADSLEHHARRKLCGSLPVLDRAEMGWAIAGIKESGYGSGKAIGIGVGAAAGAAVAVVLLVRHHHHTSSQAQAQVQVQTKTQTQTYVTGCTLSAQDRISLTNEKDNQTYSIVTDSKSLKAGERFALKGVVVPTEGSGNPVFQVQGLIKDYGACGATSASNSTSANSTSIN